MTRINKIYLFRVESIVKIGIHRLLTWVNNFCFLFVCIFYLILSLGFILRDAEVATFFFFFFFFNYSNKKFLSKKKIIGRIVKYVGISR